MTREEALTPPMGTEESIDTLKGLVFGSFGRFTLKEREALSKAIEALEAQRWITVSELLPEKEDRYLCTVEIRSGNTRGLYIEICTYYKNLYTSEGFFKWEKGLKREENVIAWMPLPEPYMNGKEK